MEEKRFQIQKTFPRATDVTVSAHYIAFATGGSVTVLSRDTKEVLFKIGKLSYCYTVLIGKEETVLIVRGTEAVLRFYSLPEGKLLKRLSLKSNEPQDNVCALDAAGEYLLYPLYNEKLCTTLLKISLSTFTVTDTLPIGEGVCVLKIWLAGDGTFLMSGFDRGGEEDWNTRWVAWCDGERILKKIAIDVSYASVTDDVLYDKERGLIYLFRYDGSFLEIDEEMKLLRKGKLDFSESEYCTELYLDEQNLYCASRDAFYICSRDTLQCLFHTEKKYGYLNVKRLTDTQILAVPFSGGAVTISV